MFNLSISSVGMMHFEFTEGERKYEVVVADRFSQCSERWDDTLGGLYLHSHYLKAVEQAPPHGLQLLFLQFFEKGQLIGQASFQALSIKGKDHYQPVEKASMCKYGFFYSLLDFVRRKIINRTRMNILIAGNLMNVGTNFFAFRDEVPNHLGLRLLGKGIKRSVIYMRKEKGNKFDSSIVKEFNAEEPTSAKVFEDYKYFKFSVEPNMHMYLRWNSFEEYLGSMSSKYRVRQRRARKKLKGLSIRELQLEDLHHYKKDMHALYLAIANNAQLNLVNVDPDYHLSLKEHLGDRIHIRGYFKEDKLVGFFTLLHNDTTLDAGYLGILTEENHRHQIYLNMLYDMIAYGIKHHMEELVFARTALEIKSSVGAVPQEKSLFLRHQNPLWHKLSKEFLKAFNTPPEWRQRHPFKG
jgi:hypothetical protein